MDGNGSTHQNPDHLSHNTSWSLSTSSLDPLCRVEVTKRSLTPLRHVEFDFYGPVTTGDADLRGANRQGAGVSKAARLVKINGIRSCGSVDFLCQFTLSP